MWILLPLQDMLNSAGLHPRQLTRIKDERKRKKIRITSLPSNSYFVSFSFFFYSCELPWVRNPPDSGRRFWASCHAIARPCCQWPCLVGALHPWQTNKSIHYGVKIRRFLSNKKVVFRGCLWTKSIVPSKQSTFALPCMKGFIWVILEHF